MPTAYSDINDLFLQQVNDYRLTSLYNSDILNDTTNLDTYLMGFMVLAIPEFSGCTQDLSLRDDTSTFTFTETLTDENKKMLSRLMLKVWLGKEVRDVLQMRSKIQTDFKTYSEAQNLREKQNSLNILREELSQELIDYYYKNNDWSDWYAGNFSGI